MNPSWEIAAGLPNHLPPLNPSCHAGQRERPSVPPVRIFVHPAPVRVSYQVVRGLIPKLWECRATATDSDADRPAKYVANDVGDLFCHPLATATGAVRRAFESTTDRTEGGPPPGTSIDLVVHIGMAGPRLVYSLERIGHRNTYRMRDVDGKLPDDDRPRHECGGKGEDQDDDDEDGGEGRGDEKGGKRFRNRDDCSFRGCPETLETAFDVADVWQRWKQLLPRDVETRVSSDAGRYLCDFVFFSSLAYLYRKKETRRVVFLHVPCDASDAMVARGRNVTINLIRALVESLVTIGYKEGKQTGDDAAGAAPPARE